MTPEQRKAADDVIDEILGIGAYYGTGISPELYTAQQQMNTIIAAKVDLTCPKKDKWRFRLWRAFKRFLGVQPPPVAGSCSTGQGIGPAVRFTLRDEWILFWVCVGLDALVLYALMAYAEHYAR